nr:hypothetical protein [Tanacetum cinerariifolium]
MTPESVQAMIDQALLRNSTNGDRSHNAALTWWNSQIRSLGPDAYSMTWEVLKKKITNKYCPQGEIKKLEIELWNLKVKGNDVPAYTEHFLITFTSVKASKPKTLDETIELANDLMDQKLRTYAERKQTTKGRLMIHLETTMVTNNKPSKGKMSPRCHVVIVCDEKMARVPYGNETLIFYDNESNNERESRLTVISCSKAQEYMEKGWQIFLAQISAKKEEDKSEGKQLKDIPICYLLICYPNTRNMQYQ